MPSFTEILDKPMSEIEEPKPAPAGQYLCVVQGMPEGPKVVQEQGEDVEVIDFRLKPITAGPEIDQTELQAAGGLSDKIFNLRFRGTEAGKWAIKKFINDHLGIPASNNLSENLAQCPGKQVYAIIKHTIAKDGSGRVFTNIASTAKA